MLTCVIAFSMVVAAVDQSPSDRYSWHADDVAYESVFAALVVVDVLQTADGLYHHGRAAMETNPILGHRPRPAALIAEGLGGIVLHALVSRVLPRPFRMLWQLSTIALEADCVRSNYRLGVRFAVPW